MVEREVVKMMKRRWRIRTKKMMTWWPSEKSRKEKKSRKGKGKVERECDGRSFFRYFYICGPYCIVNT